MNLKCSIRRNASKRYSKRILGSAGTHSQMFGLCGHTGSQNGNNDNICLLVKSLCIVGFLPNFVGIVPEKCIKLTVNDVMRRFLSSDGRSITMRNELLAAATAGLCQVGISTLV